MGYKQARLRRLNDAPVFAGGDYVLHWMQLYRRLERNHACAATRKSLCGYAEEGSEPRSLAEGHASGLSPYLPFGHSSIEEVVESRRPASGRGSGGSARAEGPGPRRRGGGRHHRRCPADRRS